MGCQMYNGLADLQIVNLEASFTKELDKNACTEDKDCEAFTTEIHAPGPSVCGNYVAQQTMGTVRTIQK